MDEILRRLSAIESLLWAILGFMVLFVTAVVASLSSRDNAFARLLPKINNYAKRGIYALDVKLQKRKKLKNMNGAPVTPDVDDGIMRSFVRVLLREIEQKQQAGGSMADVSLVEADWVTNGRFAEVSGGSPKDFRACMDRLEAARIIERKDKRGTRGWRQPYASITSKLKGFIK